MKAVKCAVIMDDIDTVNTKKDSTLAMMLEAQRRGHELFYLRQRNMYYRDGQVFADVTPVDVFDDPTKWYEPGKVRTVDMSEMSVILMRKDPPFNMEYLYTTYMLELLEEKGVLVVNKPQSLRDANEKVYISWFPQCCPPTIVTRNTERLHDFIEQQQHVVLKPLDTMGGASIFAVKAGDPNTNVIIETLTENGERSIMGQRFIDAVKAGDKRILLIDGEPIPYGLSRIPPDNDFRANLAVGGKGIGAPLSERELWICQQVGPTLRKKGLLFVGLDVIGDYVTEINVTSPTCIRELDAQYDLNIAGVLFDKIVEKITSV